MKLFNGVLLNVSCPELNCREMLRPIEESQRGVVFEHERSYHPFCPNAGKKFLVPMPQFEVDAQEISD